MWCDGGDFWGFGGDGYTGVNGGGDLGSGRGDGGGVMEVVCAVWVVTVIGESMGWGLWVEVGVRVVV